MIDKAPLASKKFLALLLGVLVFACSIMTDDSIQVRLAAIGILGFLLVGYIGGQAWLDRYIQFGKANRPRELEGPTGDIEAEGGPVQLNESVNADKTIDG